VGRTPATQSGQALTVHAPTARLGEVDAAWGILRERVPEDLVIEFANLLLAFEANKANGGGGLLFNAGQGQAHDWSVTSGVTVHSPLTKAGQKA
jgi:hypothetical protein